MREAPERLIEIGQRYVQVGKLLGMKVTSRWEVTAIEPGRLLTSVGTLAPGVRNTLTQRLEPMADGRTRLSIDIDYTLPGCSLGRLAARAGVEQRAGREAHGVLDGLRATAEATPSRSSAAIG